jgi:hypothetical protein
MLPGSLTYYSRTFGPKTVETPHRFGRCLSSIWEQDEVSALRGSVMFVDAPLLADEEWEDDSLSSSL